MADIKILPLFPLNIVGYPGERLNLHIFEPRYKQMINECLESGNTFGLPAFIDKKVMDFGTEMRVVELVKTYDDGKMDIRCEGVSVFRIIEFFQLMPDKLYMGARVSVKQVDYNYELEQQTKMLNLLDELFNEIGLSKKFDEVNAYAVAHYVGFTLKQEYELLTKFTESERMGYIINHINTIMPNIKRGKLIRDRIQMNGHFRKFDPLDL